SIVTVYQAGISADGRPYIVMEYCPGSLAQRYRVERMPVAEVLSIGVRMSGALESAHHAGLVHRDVKPSNILVTTFGAPVLADFGISSSLV
ncbi:protein kinase, partial [Klebsiella pneumoniae]